MPSIEIVYVCVTKGQHTRDFAARFVASFLRHPPLVPVSLTVACNGGPLDLETRLIFQALESCELWPRANDSSWDLGAYYGRAKATKADMLVCLGESVYFHRGGWMVPMVEFWDELGPGMYGFFSSNYVRAHLNTTGFVISPQLLLEFPQPINHPGRYNFEHGQRSFWRYLASKKIPVGLVTWDGFWPPEKWREPQEILWRGDQTNLLAWCNHSDKFAYANPRLRSEWSMNADRPFK